jgi:hypothetical protein
VWIVENRVRGMSEGGGREGRGGDLILNLADGDVREEKGVKEGRREGGRKGKNER